MTDFYQSNAEYYGALTADWQAPTAAFVRKLIGKIDGGVAVDFGSGTGAILPVLKDLGASELYAVEPSEAMRAGLVATLATDHDLLAHTTVVRFGVPEALDRLPDVWSAAVMLNVIGHLDDDARAQLWSALGERLVPDGCFVVALQPPAAAVTIPWTDFGTVNIGRDQVRTRGRAEPIDDTSVNWTMEWTVLDADGNTVEQRTAEHTWRTLSVEDLTAEAAPHGLTVAGTAGDGMMVGFRRA
ncbi:MAG: class I SAM-dependent methyltransferase [Gordonia sp. (in: high G+C Gram-positive bacteria)]|uniref:class I SAM-dependent methyltransferase n=1 Tax=Gordonia sp. (in: high G+C Gram-positive bacteria) TaxID=84139 RepID=UPI0039E64E26